jgi:hypothetical protein
MARVNVEDGAIAAATSISAATEIGYHRVLGALVLLWQASQAAGISVAKEYQVLVWMGFKRDDIVPNSLIEAMIDAGVLRTAEGGRFEIVGNQRHIDNLREHRERARENGKNGGRPKKTDVGSNAITDAITSVQYSSVQNSTEKNTLAKPTHTPLVALGNKKRVKSGIRAEYSPEFETAWGAYRRYGNKAEAYEAFREQDLTPDEYQALLSAIPPYLADCGRRERSQKYFATFLREDWRPWIPAEPQTREVYDPEVAS